MTTRLDHLPVRLPLVLLGVVSMTSLDGGNGLPAPVASQVLAPVPKGVVEWTMINVNVTEKQGDAHLLRFPDGQVYLIDAADGGFVAPWLVKHGVRRLDKIIISHAHKDHYGGIPDILDKGIAVRELVLNVPDKPLCDCEKPWGCDWDDVQATLALAMSHGIQVRGATAGDRLYLNGAVSLQVLAAYDGVHTPVGPTDINDTSLILLLRNDRIRALFAGDLNRALGGYLAAHEPRVHADILKVPHHGTEDLAPNEFFQTVSPKVALVPSPRTLWLSERSRRTREYFQAGRFTTYVNGIDGDVTVRLRSRRYSISTTQSTQGYPH